MYKCECGAMFKEPYKYYEDTGELFRVCPTCHETSFDEVIKCKLCGQWFEQFNGNEICYNCAEEAYETRLGLKFIDRHKEDFITTVYEIENYNPESELVKIRLLDALEKDYFDNFNEDSYLSKEKENQIKEFCLEDLDTWIAFLEREGDYV